MAASETVRLRLQFDYPPPTTPHCTTFWLLVDLNRCRVVTDLISLIRQRFGFSSGAPLGLYLAEGLLPPGESARLVRDNDNLRVKLEERGVTENPAIVSCNDNTHALPRKARKRALKLEEDEETELGNKNPKKHWKKQENNSNNDLESRSVTDQSVRTKGKRKIKATCKATDDEEETKRKTPKKREKREYKKQTRISKSSKALIAKDWTLQNYSPLKNTPSRNSSLAKAKRKGGSSICTKGSPSSSTDSESCTESVSDGHSNANLEVKNSSEKIPTELSKDAPSTKNANKVATKTSLNSTPAQGKTTRPSSSCSDSSSGSDEQCMVTKSSSDGVAGFLKTVGLFVGRSCSVSGPTAQPPVASGWKFPDLNDGKQALGPPPNVTLPISLGRGWGRGEELFSWKAARGRGIRGRGRGRGRGQTVSNILNRNTESQKQQQLNETNPVEIQKKDYSLLPLLAAAPQVGEKIAFKLLELTSNYSPDVSEYKEGKILSHNPETQQVDIEILSSLPALKEPGKFDLVYHNENGAEVVEYAVTQEKTITVFWRELIDPRLIVESSNNIPSTEHASTS
ncbi:coilin [Erinaceus europaeus]|uniref:Coilin n=1 Tax=Erinaceus europaeus TaxID=9365 RepID=A0A1S3WGP9_ERIEU|nr:coilin [Erinaceus europaeus]